MEIGHSYRSAADILGRTYNQVREACKRYTIPSMATGPVELPAPPRVPLYDNAPCLSGDFLVVCDVHAPATDWLMASRAAMVANKYLTEPRRLLIVGDLMNYDVLSKYEALVPVAGLQQELEAARHAIQLWKQTFSEIVLTMGNHDYRWVKSLLGVYPEDTMVDLFNALLHNPQGLKISIYPYSTVETCSGLWHFSHMARYAQTPLMKARKKANVHKDRHIALAHQHHIGMALDESSKYVIADLPMLADEQKLAYVGLGDSDQPHMKRGFAMLRNGALTLFSDNPAWTDWGFWL